MRQKYKPPYSDLYPEEVVFHRARLFLLVCLAVLWVLGCQVGAWSQPNTTTVPTPVNLRTTAIVKDGKAGTAVQADLPPGANSKDIVLYGWFADSVFSPSARLATSTSPYVVLPEGKLSTGQTIHCVAYRKIGGVLYASVPSQAAYCIGKSPWWGSAPPPTTGTIKAEIESNDGIKRLRLSWGSDNKYDQLQTGFNIYRDGEPIARNVYLHEYFRFEKTPGDLLGTYKVLPVNFKPAQNPGMAPVMVYPAETEAKSLESASSVKVENDNAPKLPATPATINIAKILPSDDSFRVFFDPVEGAKDYRVCILSSDSKEGHTSELERIYKYSAGGLSIEQNGIAPRGTSRFIVEAVDKFGPFQTEDFSDARFVGGASPSGQITGNLNGIGNPSNVPNVIARSEVKEVTAVPVLFGKDPNSTQVFFDNFRNSKPFKALTMGKEERRRYFHGDMDGGGYNVGGWENDLWRITTSDIHPRASSIFVMGNHFMDVLQDGGPPRTNVDMHNNRGNMAMSPKQVFDFASGTLHISFEADLHTHGRAWISIAVLPSDAKYFILNNELVGNKINGNPLGERITPDNDNYLKGETELGGKYLEALVFAIRGNSSRVVQVDPALGMVPIPRESKDSWRDDTYSPDSLNGDMTWLDKRHRVDIWITKTHIKATEDRMDGTAPVVLKDEDLPLAIQNQSVKVYFQHQFYHSSERVKETTRWKTQETYWYNYSPYRDERHWDNMGVEVLK
jgi:hypothetical protein